ncbi:uncharacterized protein G2W53_007443 [Senna tora]|uniref:Uncharacterized protein n=1 Tax=Senna tora TaxID=362788 RepID=A0A835CDN5_9FABA|nr:uncharacterized protein G2W53_007443 [Senna tora]
MASRNQPLTSMNSMQHRDTTVKVRVVRLWFVPPYSSNTSKPNPGAVAIQMVLCDSEIKKQLASLYRGSDSLATYSNKLEKLWYELLCLQPKRNGCSTCIDCDCGSFKKADKIYTSNYVDQFLMGLGEEYENFVSNILLMDPILSYSIVYAMVARVERQRSVNTSNAIEASALLARANEQQRNVVEKSAGLKYEDRKKEKASKYCSHYCKTRHTAETCFKKHGYPDWFKEYKNQKDKRNTDSINAAIDDTTKIIIIINFRV